MKKNSRFIYLFLLFLWLPDAYGETVTIIMDYYPPFSYEENGEIRGVSTQVVKAVVQEAGLEATIKQYPFVRAYKTTQEEANIFEYCVARTPEREKLFQWVGAVTPAKHGLLALKSSNIRIQSLEDLKHYRIGTVYEDLVDQYLRGKQKKYGLKLDRVASYDLNMKKLFKKRFHLLGGNLFSTMYLAQQKGYSANDIKVAYAIEELTSEYYLVTGLKTPEMLTNRLKAAFEKIRQTGVYQKILDEYSFTNP